MFEEIPFIIGFMIVSIIASNIIRYLPSPINIIIFAIANVGVILHELCHYMLCIITRTPVEHVSLLHVRPTGKPNSYSAGGEVIIKEEAKLTFLKAFLIGLAPLYILFWAFWFLWDLIRNAGFNEWTNILMILLMCAMILGGAPSFEDLKSIGRNFNKDSNHSFYQVFLVFLSIITVSSIIISFQIQLGQEILFYFWVALGYAIFRYSFMGIKRIWKIFRSW